VLEPLAKVKAKSDFVKPEVDNTPPATVHTAAAILPTVILSTSVSVAEPELNQPAVLAVNVPVILRLLAIIGYSPSARVPTVTLLLPEAPLVFDTDKLNPLAALASPEVSAALAYIYLSYGL